MPMFVLNTNVTSANVPLNYSTSCAQLVAEILSKPVEVRLNLSCSIQYTEHK